MIINWSTKEIKAQVDRISWAESDPKMDGFVTWECKQDLYELYWYIEDKLEKCSTYVGEQEFVESRREHKIIKKMSGIK
jgi:hypothetical protein